MLHGVPWSSYVNCPRDARTYWSVVVQALVRVLLFEGSFTKFVRPSAKSSTYMSQSVIWMASNTTRRVNSVVHGIDTSMCFAVRNGRDSGVRPSMTRSSTEKLPRHR